MGRQSAVYRSTYYNVVVQSDIKIEAFERTWNVYIPSPPRIPFFAIYLRARRSSAPLLRPNRLSRPPLHRRKGERGGGRRRPLTPSANVHTCDDEVLRARSSFRSPAPVDKSARPLPTARRRRKNSRFHLEMRQALPPSLPSPLRRRQTSGICSHRHSRSHRLRHRSQRVSE